MKFFLRFSVFLTILFLVTIDALAQRGEGGLITGTINVGSGETVTSLTNTGGLFELLNNGTIGGNLTINITSDLITETGSVALNQSAEMAPGNYTVTFRPVGAARQIRGNNAAGLIRLNGADRISFDGTPVDTNQYGLIFTNESTTGSTISIAGNSNDTSIISCFAGKPGGTGTVLLVGPGAGTGNERTTISDSWAGSTDGAPVETAIGSIGISTGQPANTGFTVRRTTVNRFYRYGIRAEATEDVLLSENFITHGFVAPVNQHIAGISMGLTNTNHGTNRIEKNTIVDLVSSQFAGGGTSTAGIELGDTRNLTVTQNAIREFPGAATGDGNIVGIHFIGATGTSASATITNNMISLIPSANTVNRVMGILDSSLGSGNSVNATHNTIYLGGNSTTGVSWCLLRERFLTSTTTWRNNFLFNNRTGTASKYSVGDQSPASGTFSSNNNYFIGAGPSGNNHFDLGTASLGTPVTFATWQAGTPARDAASGWAGQDFDPAQVFVSQNFDLHLLPTAIPALFGNAGIVSITTDFDGDPIDPGQPDIGADQLIRATGGMIGSGTFYNVLLAPGNVISGNLTVTGRLDLTGVVSPVNPNDVLEIGCGGQIFGGSETAYFTGKMKRNFCRDTFYFFPVGAGTGYSPVNINSVAVFSGGSYPSSLTVNAVDDFLPGIVQVNGVSRYWSIVETGDVVADLYLYYRDEDVNGDESQYKAFRHTGMGQPQMVAAFADPANNSVRTSGTTQFSDWGVGTLVPTSANVDLGGRVLDASGMPIRNAHVMVSGGGLPQPVTVQTSSFGYYRVTGLQAGQTYTVMVGAKRYRFVNPVRIITLGESIADIDFISNR